MFPSNTTFLTNEVFSAISSRLRGLLDDGRADDPGFSGFRIPADRRGFDDIQDGGEVE